ncbi:actin cytoskeleton-regulatory complex protein pan1-like [Amphibalanus amphitrite]|uniref:actin cytoskeleton-regulatory complex protein pan1-like n=1 Tax=Amphibalanus amphitrite TaxID=1232801 RepID=UPI001C928CF0|nr:actin cytoskeleton-regulatory complex protein pan1-like [Amphibalanus amphitrite]XP_043214782.1 actin cytoskeleton-regulatory complex protein pan1-like [Amphibalanus amphitrite]
MLLRLPGPTHKKATQVDLRRPSLTTLLNRVTRADWLKLTDCQQRMQHALQRYMHLKHQLGESASHPGMQPSNVYIDGMNRALERMEAIQAEQSEILDPVREQMAAEAALKLPSPLHPVPPRPPCSPPPEQPQVRLVIEPRNQLKVSVEVLMETAPALRPAARPASARLRQSLQKPVPSARASPETEGDSMTMPDPGPEPPPSEDYRLNIPRDSDPERHAKNCHMAALGLVASEFAERLKTKVRHKPRRQAFDMAMDGFIHAALRKRKAFVAPSIAAKRPRVDGKKRKNRKARAGCSSRATSPVTEPTSRATSPVAEPMSQAESPETEPVSRAVSPETEPASQAASPDAEPVPRLGTPPPEVTSRTGSPTGESPTALNHAGDVMDASAPSGSSNVASAPGEDAGGKEAAQSEDPAETPAGAGPVPESPANGSANQRTSPSKFSAMNGGCGQVDSLASGGAGSGTSPASPGGDAQPGDAAPEPAVPVPDTTADPPRVPAEGSAVPTALPRFVGVHRRRCERCDGVGQLLTCDTCPRVWHTSCLGTLPADDVQLWSCPDCESGDGRWSESDAEREEGEPDGRNGTEVDGEEQGSDGEENESGGEECVNGEGRNTDTEEVSEDRKDDEEWEESGLTLEVVGAEEAFSWSEDIDNEEKDTEDKLTLDECDNEQSHDNSKQMEGIENDTDNCEGDICRTADGDSTAEADEGMRNGDQERFEEDRDEENTDCAVEEKAGEHLQDNTDSMQGIENEDNTMRKTTDRDVIADECMRIGGEELIEEGTDNMETQTATGDDRTQATGRPGMHGSFGE